MLDGEFASARFNSPRITPPTASNRLVSHVVLQSTPDFWREIMRNVHHGFGGFNVNHIL
jgi:hypothetical protein